MWHHHMTIFRQMTVQLQHVGARVNSTERKISNRKYMSEGAIDLFGPEALKDELWFENSFPLTV